MSQSLNAPCQQRLGKRSAFTIALPFRVCFRFAFSPPSSKQAAYMCMAKCYDNCKSSTQTVQACAQRCELPLQEVNQAVQHEINNFQACMIPSKRIPLPDRAGLCKVWGWGLRLPLEFGRVGFGQRDQDINQLLSTIGVDEVGQQTSSRALNVSLVLGAVVPPPSSGSQ